MQNVKRKIAVLLSACLLMAPGINVNAETSVHVQGDGTTTKNGGRYDGNITSNNGALANGSTDIDVQVKVDGGEEIVYDLVISYGAMKFEYDYGSTWNPSTYSYSLGKSGRQGGGWVTTGYVDGVNNKITVQNNSNFPMKATLSYVPDPTGTRLNEGEGEGTVTGIFADSNAIVSDATILAAGKESNLIDGMTSKSLSLEMNIQNLTVGTKYYSKSGNAPAAGSHVKSAYFALTGRPDNGGPTEFASVGKINVSIAPETGTTSMTRQ